MDTKNGSVIEEFREPGRMHLERIYGIFFDRFLALLAPNWCPLRLDHKAS